MRETTSTVSKMDFECDCQSDRSFQACERFLSNLSLGSSQTDNEDEEDKLIPNDILYKAYLSLKIIGEGKDFFKMILVEDNNQTFNCLIHDIASMVSNGEEMFVEQSDGSAVLVEKLQNIVTSFIWNHCKVLMRTDVFIESIQIDKYRNIFSDREILGEGGYGIVYKARHKIDKKIYALKQISENKYTYDSFCLINREVHSLTDLREHVNIVRIYKSWWELDKQSLSLYIQMELCDTDLRILLDERYCNILTQTKNPALSIDLNKSKGWLRQLVEGINYIHTKGFIHRDLKPQNIFYVNNLEKIKIGDFGLSRVNCNYSNYLGSTIGGYGSIFDTQSDNELSQGVGTTIYDAPEQRKTTKYGRKVDMYSLGVIVFELFYPFGTQSELVTAINDVKENAGPITKINEFWADIIVNLLSEEPSCRYNSRELRTKLLKTVEA